MAIDTREWTAMIDATRALVNVEGGVRGVSLGRESVSETKGAKER
jgi:hypothetical protein